MTADNLVDAKKQGAVIAYGHFITLGINFLIVAWILFLLVRAINSLKVEEAKKPSVPAPSRSEVLLEENPRTAGPAGRRGATCRARKPGRRKAHRQRRSAPTASATERKPSALRRAARVAVDLRHKAGPLKTRAE